MTARDLAERPEPGSGEPPSRSSSRSRAARGGSPLVGRYRSLFVIGRGGMGTVEVALEIEPPADGHAEGETSARAGSYERIVALKRLLPDAARDKRRIEMFLREAKVAALLDHPNIVSAYDYGELDGELYLAMEYVEGLPLSRLLQALADAGQRLPPRIVAWLLGEVCHALHAAHELVDPTTGAALNLVHRDVSPQNVMIGYDGHVRLLDFGVAKIETENVTKTGEVKGKTAYMSPEQAMGEPLDRRSDLFGVGAVLFECFALRRMWGPGTDMEIIRKLALESPPSLDSVGIDTAAGIDVPQGLAQLHARLVAREAKDRPATALDVAEELARFVDVPPETAARELREILEAHFEEQAREQRARLAAALEEIAPDQAGRLRESLHPPSAASPAHRRSAIERPASLPPASSAPVARAATRRPMVGLALAGLTIAALIGWRLVRRDVAAGSEPPIEPPLVVTTMPVVTTTVPPGPTEASSAVSTTPAPSVSAMPSTTPQRATAHPPAPMPPRRSARPTMPPPSPSNGTRTNTSVPDVDEKPF